MVLEKVIHLLITYVMPNFNITSLLSNSVSPETQWLHARSTAAENKASRSSPPSQTVLSDEQRLLQTYFPVYQQSSVPNGSLYSCHVEDHLQSHHRSHPVMSYGYPPFLPMMVHGSWKGLCPTSLRSRYSDYQTNCLKEVYAVKRYVNTEEMSELALKTGLTRHQVKTWFQNRRLKDRKVSKACNASADSQEETSRCLSVDE